MLGVKEYLCVFDAQTNAIKITINTGMIVRILSTHMDYYWSRFYNFFKFD